MAEIKNKADFEKWLDERPEKTRINEARALAARCALRVLPRLNDDTRSNDKRSELLLLTNRCLIISWAARTYPANDMAGAAAYAAAYAAADADATDAAYAAADAAAYAAYATAAGAAAAYATDAAYAAAYAAYAGAADADADAAAFAFAFAAYATDAAVAVLWEALSQDCTALENGTSIEEIITSRLWHDKIPDEINQNWQALKHSITKDDDFKDQNWDVWIRWYEDRLHGRPANEALEIARATLPNKLWEQGAKAVNSHILELEAEHNPPPPQTQGALNFKANDEGQLDLSEPARGLKHETDEDAQERHQEVLSNAQHLRNTIGSNSRTDNDPRLRELVDKFIDALGQSIQTINKNTLFPRGELLRKRNSKQETMALDRNYDSDYPPLPDDIAEILDELVGSYNILIGLDPELAKCDQLRLGPDAKKSLASPQIINNITGDFYNNCTITHNAHEAIIEEAENAPEIPELENRLSQRASEGFKNMIKATGAFIWKHIGKISASSGAVLIAASKLLVVYKIELLIALDNAPWLVRLISNIEKILPALG